MTEWFELSALKLAAMIRNKKLSPVELLEAYIRRILQINPIINGLVANRFEDARKEAQQCTERLSRGPIEDLPILFGIPCTIKEFFEVKGLPNSGGLRSRSNVVAQRNATAVQRLIDHGVIVLGVSNVPEGGMWMETYNHVYGLTANPWDLKRTSGGSSGGEAALIATGCSPFGLASDLGGSIRIPSAFCGVFGHKPSAHLVPNTGCWPHMRGEMGSFLCTGPMGRSVEDLRCILAIIEGPDHQDILVPPLQKKKLSTLELNKQTVIIPNENLLKTLHPSSRQALEEAHQALQRRGLKTKTMAFPSLLELAKLWSAVMAFVPSTTYADILADGKPFSVFQELLKVPLQRSEYTFISLTLSMLEGLISKWPIKGIRAYVEKSFEWRFLLEEELSDTGVLLFPPYTRPAPHHYTPILRPLDFAYAGIFNVWEMPVTQVPCGLSKEGLPVGVQVVASRGNDSLTLAIAELLEEDLGGFQLCPYPVYDSANHPAELQKIDNQSSHPIQ